MGSLWRSIFVVLLGIVVILPELFALPEHPIRSFGSDYG